LIFGAGLISVKAEGDGKNQPFLVEKKNLPRKFSFN